MSVRKREWTTRKGEHKEAWLVDYVDQHNRRHIETYPLRKDAKKREDKIKEEIGKGTHVAVSDSITIKEAAVRWIARCEADGLEAASIQNYQEQVRLHILPRLGDNTKLAKLTPPLVEAFRDSLLKGNEQHKALSHAMARKVFTTLKMMLRANKHAHIADGIRIKASRQEQRAIEVGTDFPTPDEVKHMIAKAETPRQRALLLTMVLTGLRASELRGLRWSDVEPFEAAELRVRQRADRYRNLSVPKSKAGKRNIPLPPDLISVLKVWKLNCPISKEDLVFPSGRGNIDANNKLLRYLTPVMVKARVVTLDDKKRVKPKYGLHAFRHFFASWCINPKNRNGRELQAKEVQVLMGHSNITMTLDVYGHLFPSKGDHVELAAATRALLLT
jgi:integrase